MRTTVSAWSPACRHALSFSLLQQVPSALLSLLLRDGGRSAKVSGVTVLGFGGAVVSARFA